MTLRRKRARVGADALRPWTLPPSTTLLSAASRSDGSGRSLAFVTTPADSASRLDVHLVDGTDTGTMTSAVIGSEQDNVIVVRNANTYTRHLAVLHGPHSSSLRVFDCWRNEFVSSLLASPAPQIDHAFVSGDGSTIVLVDRVAGHLWCSSHGSSDGWAPRHLGLEPTDTIAGRFFDSPWLGRCFQIVRLRVRDGGWTVIQEVLDVDDEWAVVSTSSTAHPCNIQPVIDSRGASISSCGQWVAVHSGRYVFCLPTTAESSAPVNAAPLEDAVATAAWQQSTLAVLLCNGRVFLFERLPNGVLDPITIDSSKGISLHLDLGSSVSASSSPRIWWARDASSLFSIANNALVEWKIEFTHESLPPASSAATQNQPLAPSSVVRRRRRRLQSPRQPTVDSVLATALQVPRIPPHELLTLARLCLSSSAQDADLVFTLLAVLHQQVLAQLGLHRALEALHPQVLIGIAKMLLAALVTMDLRDVQVSAQRLVESPVFTSRSARREYFGRCIHTLSTVVQLRLSHRPLVPSTETASFIRFIRARLLPELSSCSLNREADARILRLMVDASSTEELLHQAQEANDRLQQRNGSDVAPSRVALGLAAYWLLCDALALPSCTLDVLHLLTLPRTLAPEKVEWLQPFCSSRQPQDVASVDVLTIVGRAGAFACVAGSLSALLTLLLDARPQDCKLYERTLLALIACGRDESQRNELRAIAIEWLVGAAIAELRQLPVLPLEQDARLNGLEAFIRHLYHPSEPQQTTDASERIVTSARVVLTMLTGLLGSGGLADALREVLLVDQVWTPSYASCTSEANCDDDDFQTLENVRQLFLGDTISAASRTGQDCSYRGVLRLRGSLERRSFEPTRRGLIPQALRTLSSLVWCLWARHRLRESWYASSKDKVTTGASVAVSALLLNVWTPFRDDVDEIRGLQLALLERAALLDSATAARILAWGFPPEAIHARLLKRYKALRSLVAQECEEPLDAQARRLELLRRRLRGQVLPRPEHSPDRARQERDARWWTSKGDVDAFLDGCCSAELQRVAWAMMGHRFSVVPVRRNTMMRRSAADGGGGGVTRQELAALLQRQKEELEQRMQRVAGLLSEGIHARVRVDEYDIRSAPSTSPAEASKAASTTIAPSTEATKPLSAKWQAIRELEAREHVSSAGDAPLRDEDQQEARPIRKGASCQNVLKLLQLRKDDQVKRRQSLPRMTIVSPETQETSPASPAKRTVEVAATKAAVPPLRLPGASSDRVAVALLRTTAQRRAVSLKPRAFVAELNEQSAVDPVEQERGASQQAVSTGVQCVVHKTTSAQTDAIEEEDVPSVDGEASSGSPPSAPALAPAPETVATDPLSTSSSSAPAVVETRDAHVQFDSTVQASSTSSSALAAITKRFPVSVSLATGDRPSSFLRISKLDVSSTRRLPQRRSSPEAAAETTVETPEPLDALPHEDTGHLSTVEPVEDAEAVKQRRRQLYREHFAGKAASSRPQRRVTGDSFLTIKSEMERMKLKLSELESCAADIEEGFRSTYNSLESFQRPTGGRPSTILEVDEAIERTSQRATRGATTLSVKAASELDAARRILDQIDQVATGGDRP